jgi:ribosomal protein L21E
MQRFTKGDRVRVDIPDETDPDHDQYHGVHGHVVTILTDDAEAVTGDEWDGHLYRVSLSSGETTDFRWRDLRPPIDEDDNSTS